MNSTLESITIPSALKEIESTTFNGCNSIKRIEFLEGIQTLGDGKEDTDFWNKVFRDCIVEEIMLPGTLKKISPDLFNSCDNLKIVQVAKGCKVKVRKFVSNSVKVLTCDQQHRIYDAARRQSYISNVLRILGLVAMTVLVFYLGRHFPSDS